MRKNILKKVFGLSLLILLICVTSCSKTETKNEVKKETAPEKISVASTNINGPLGDYFEIVNKNYKWIKDGSKWKINVELKRISDGGPQKSTSYNSFTLNLLDADNDIIGSDDAGYWDDEQLNMLYALRVGETSPISFKFNENIASKTKSIKIASQWDKDKEIEYGYYGKSNSDENETNDSQATSESSFSASNVILPSQLKGKVSVISASKSVDSYGFPEVSVTFKLLSKVNTKSMCSSYGQMWIVGAGQNASGVDVKELLPNYKEWRSDDSDGDQFKSFLEGSPGETITLDFTGSKDNSNNVSADLAKVAKFKLKITN